MAYMPLWRVKAWPADDKEGSYTLLNVIPGSNWAEGTAKYTSTAKIIVPEEYDVVLDDFGNFATQLLQTGTWIQIEVVWDGDWAGANVEIRFYGSVTSVDSRPVTDESGVHQDVVLQCEDQTAKGRGSGVEMNFQTSMKILPIEFTSADFDAADPNFLVNIPTDSLTSGYEFVPNLMVHLRAEYVDPGEPDPDALIVDEFDSGQFVYNSDNKTIYFNSSQVTRKSLSATWKGSVYYYDPLDTDHSVTDAIQVVAIGDPYSRAGGLGFDIADVDLEEIEGFDSNPKLVRSIIRTKTDGTTNQFFDELNERGLKPYNYRLQQDPTDRKFKGGFIYQAEESAALIPAHGVLGFSRNSTMEGKAGRVEIHSRAVTPKLLSDGAAVTLNPPGSGSGYEIVKTGATGEELTDLRPDTFVNFQRTSTGLGSEYPPQESEYNAMVVDIDHVDTFGSILYRNALPYSAGLGEAYRIYMITRNQRITISASPDPITADNPGIPISEESIAIELDPLKTEEWITIEAVDITQARYFAIWFNQDFFFRNEEASALDPTVERTSAFCAAELRVLGDGRLRYDKIIVGGITYDHPDQGQVPYVEVKGVAQVTTVASVVDTTHFTLTDTTFMEAGDFIQVKAGVSDPIITRIIAKGSGGDLTVNPAIPGVAPTDAVGEYNRWVPGFDVDLHDMYFPKLHQKLQNTTQWLEIIDQVNAQDEYEAEQLCYDRTMEMIGISSDHNCRVAYDPLLRAGVTTKPYVNEEPFLVTRCVGNLNAVDNLSEPPVTLNLEGTNYLEANE